MPLVRQSSANFGFCPPGKRDYQQDRYLILPDFKPEHRGDEQVNCCLVAVFDGHKSEQAAQLAKNKMPGILGARKAATMF